MPPSLVERLIPWRRGTPAANRPSWAALTGRPQASARLLLGTREIEIQAVQRRWRGELPGAIRTLSCPPVEPEEPVWHATLSALDTYTDVAAQADLVLSNDLVRYAVMPWVAGMHGDTVQEAYVRHHFSQTQALSGELWSVRYCEQNWGMPYLATAVETALLDGLRAAFATRAVALRSIQTLFAWAYNRWCTQFQGAHYWFVSAESHRLVIARVTDGNWESVRSHRVRQHWTHELPLLLTRARLQSPSAAAGGAVYVTTPGLAGTLVTGEWLATGLRLPLPGMVSDAVPPTAKVAG